MSCSKKVALKNGFDILNKEQSTINRKSKYDPPHIARNLFRPPLVDRLPSRSPSSDPLGTVSKEKQKSSCPKHIGAFAFLRGLIRNRSHEGQRGGVAFDQFLLLVTILIHDHGEGILHRDVPLLTKTAEKDRDEYEGFAKLLQKCGLDLPLKKKLERAFLLQFAEECPECFPEEAKNVMREIREHNHFEIMLFKALERLDYLFYACESCHLKDDDVILTEVIENSKRELDKACAMCPIISEVLWTTEVQEWFFRFAHEHKGISYESKDPQLSLAIITAAA